MTTPLFTHRIRPIVVDALRHARIGLISGARQRADPDSTSTQKPGHQPPGVLAQSASAA
jgi:hypothetical protein